MLDLRSYLLVKQQHLLDKIRGAKIVEFEYLFETAGIALHICVKDGDQFLKQTFTCRTLADDKHDIDTLVLAALKYFVEPTSSTPAEEPEPDPIGQFQAALTSLITEAKQLAQAQNWPIPAVVGPLENTLALVTYLDQLPKLEAAE